MTQYFLLDSDAEKRLIIDDNERAGCSVENTTEEACWIEAKKLLGFELTVLQEAMLLNRVTK